MLYSIAWLIIAPAVMTPRPQLLSYVVYTAVAFLFYDKHTCTLSHTHVDWRILALSHRQLYGQIGELTAYIWRITLITLNILKMWKLPPTWKVHGLEKKDLVTKVSTPSLKSSPTQSMQVCSQSFGSVLAGVVWEEHPSVLHQSSKVRTFTTRSCTHVQHTLPCNGPTLTF